MYTERQGKDLDQLVHRIELAFRAFTRNVRANLSNIHPAITKPQLFMLHTIQQYNQCKLTQLAEVLEVKPSAITVMIDRLEKVGLVERISDPSDRRVIIVQPTESGIDVLQKAHIVRTEAIKRYLNHFSQKEIEQFTYLLEKFVYEEVENESLDI